jgi:Predicted nucleotide-binding protein containing TIR-like domain/TIR domain
MESLRVKIFISYQAEDGSTATSLRRELNRLPNMSAYNLHLPGVMDDRTGRKVFDLELLYRSIGYPDIALVLLSPHYLSDPWFYHEMPALFALETELRSEFLIPILANGVKDEQIPHYLRGRPSVDLRQGEFKTAFPRVVELIEEREKGRASEVFVVHGHGETREVVARFLEKIGLTPILLVEQPSGSSTIIEKLEHNRQVGYAIVILTPDDVGASRENPANLQPRPRQNVVFEMGFFMGILERHRVCALLSGFSGPPADFSDFLGIVSISMNGDWKTQLAKELRAQGFLFDAQKLLQ